MEVTTGEYGSLLMVCSGLVELILWPVCRLDVYGLSDGKS